MADINVVQKSAQNLKRMLLALQLLWGGQPVNWEYSTCMTLLMHFLY